MLTRHLTAHKVQVIISPDSSIQQANSIYEVIELYYQEVSNARYM